MRKAILLQRRVKMTIGCFLDTNRMPGKVCLNMRQWCLLSKLKGLCKLFFSSFNLLPVKRKLTVQSFSQACHFYGGYRGLIPFVPMFAPRTVNSLLLVVRG